MTVLFKPILALLFQVVEIIGKGAKRYVCPPPQYFHWGGGGGLNDPELHKPVIYQICCIYFPVIRISRVLLQAKF